MAGPRDLHVSSPMMSGKDVQAIQARLKVLGYPPGVLDGYYGATTFAAVKLFQRSRKITADGVVGAQTRAALKAAKPKAPQKKPIPATKPRVGMLALREAVKHIGVVEKPRGSNKQKFGVWFGVNGVAWCNIFASYCFKVGANAVLCKGFQGAGVYAGKGCTYVPTTEAWLRATGKWIGRTTPQPGDIAIYNWDGGVPDHIGIVEEYLGGGRFTAIEGNTAVGNDSNGGEVMRRERFLSQVDGFGRLG